LKTLISVQVNERLRQSVDWRVRQALVTATVSWDYRTSITKNSGDALLGDVGNQAPGFAPAGQQTLPE
jgi:hypothetical protein